MRTLTATIILFLACKFCHAGYSQPDLELIVTLDNVVCVPSPVPGDSIIIPVYVENLVEAIGGLDVWISLNHGVVVRFMSDSVWRCDTVYYGCQDSNCIEWVGDECIAWEYFNCQDSLLCRWVPAGAVSFEGTAIEDWSPLAIVYGEQRMLLQILGAIPPGPPIPPGVGPHLIAKLAFEITDTSGHVADSICEEVYYEQYGVTLVRVEAMSVFSNETGTGFLGWDWRYTCEDSICIEWDGDSCIAWECTDWDSVYAPDTSKIEFTDGSVTLNCGCDLLIGDADGSGTVDIDDVVYLVYYIFSGGPAPVPYEVASGDPNSDCSVDIDDAVYLIEHIFSGGPLPLTCDDWMDSCGPLH